MHDVSESHEIGHRAVPRLLVVMEGAHDVSFLKGMSQALHRHLDEVPDLAAAEANGRVMFLHLAGQITVGTTCRYASLGLPEFHLYASKSPSQLEWRQPIVESLQQRPNCAALLTRKRSFENYLHPQVVHTCRGETIDIADDTDVPGALAARFVDGGGACWAELSRRHRRRLFHEARKWLCTTAVREMTLNLLEQRDQPYELIDWLMTIDSLIASPSEVNSDSRQENTCLVAV